MNTRALTNSSILNGKYMIQTILGEGGFGITYLAFDLVLKEKVAIKEYFPSALATRDTTSNKTDEITIITGESDENFKKGLEKFVNEASNLAKFQKEEGIVSVKNFFYENNTAYMVMEYIDGDTLKEYLAQHGEKLPYETVLNMMKLVMKSLVVVHEAGIIHRDISPDNIMVTKDGKMKLIDFGAARFVGNEDEKSLTVMLKEGYAPPEQYQTNGNQGPWTDVYALCATIYRMLSGTVPVEAPARVMNREMLAPIQDVPGKVNKAIIKGMSIDVISRHQTIKALLESLEKNTKKTSIAIMSFAIVVLVIAVVVKKVNIMNKETEVVTSETENIKAAIEDNTSKVQSEEEKAETVPVSSNEVKEAEVEEDLEAEFLSQIENLSGQEVNEYIYDDYDGDGTKEMFAMIIKDSGDGYTTNTDVWISDKDGASLVEKALFFYNPDANVLQFGRKKQFAIYDLAPAGDGYFMTSFAYENEKAFTIQVNGSSIGSDSIGRACYSATQDNPYLEYYLAIYHFQYPMYYASGKYYVYSMNLKDINYLYNAGDADSINNAINSALSEFMNLEEVEKMRNEDSYSEATYMRLQQIDLFGLHKYNYIYMKDIYECANGSIFIDYEIWPDEQTKMIGGGGIDSSVDCILASIELVVDANKAEVLQVQYGNVSDTFESNITQWAGFEIYK